MRQFLAKLAEAWYRFSENWKNLFVFSMGEARPSFRPLENDSPMAPQPQSLETNSASGKAGHTRRASGEMKRMLKSLETKNP
ncbi:MAG TPA: hypothetical protein VGG79_25010 [Roseiarcus sp.]|jgi:hypothetical protein